MPETMITVPYPDSLVHWRDFMPNTIANDEPRFISPELAKILNLVPTDQEIGTHELTEKYKLIESCGDESKVVYKRMLESLRALRHKGYVRSRYLEGSSTMVHKRNVVLDDTPQGQTGLKTSHKNRERQVSLSVKLIRLAAQIEYVTAQVRDLSNEAAKYDAIIETVRGIK